MRDESSDVYRVEENENLKLNIRQGGVLGKGFGLPIDYALGITDISSIDPLIRFVPHNGVLLHLHAHGALWSDRVLVAPRDRDHHGMPPRPFEKPRGRRVRRAAGLRDRRLRIRGLLRQGLLHVPDRLRDRDAARPGRGGAPPGGWWCRAHPWGHCRAPARISPGRFSLVPSRPAPVARQTPRAKVTAPHRRRRDRIAQLVSLVLLPIAIAFFIWLFLAGTRSSATIPAERPLPRLS